MEHLPGTDLTRVDVMTTGELHDSGYHGRDIARLVALGALTRLRHGSYTHGETWTGLDLDGRRQLVDVAVLRGARTGVVLSHTSAALRLGAPVWDLPDRTHLQRLDQRAGRHEAGKVQHRGALSIDDVTVRDGIPMTSGTRTALDVSAMTDVEHALVTVDGLIEAGETSPDLLARQRPLLERHPGALSTRLVLSLAGGCCTSPGESRTHHLLWRAGLTPVVAQHPVRDRNGRVLAYLDFAWPQDGVFLEFDGRVKYDSLLRPGETAADVVMREKAREQMIIALTGWRIIRITWADLANLERTIRRINGVLEGRPCAA